MAGTRISLPNGDAATYAYLAPSASGSGVGVVVLQEYWGLVPHIEDICDRFSAEGFTAMAPDLFQGDTTTDPDDATTMMQALNIGTTEAILRNAILSMLTNPAVTSERVGIVGFCMGGQLALLAATINPAIGACVDYYGIHPNVRPVLRDLQCPLLGFFAERDHMTPPTAVAALDAELALLRKDFDLTIYPGVDHAFFNDTRPEVYNAEAAQDSWDRMLAFFRKNLG